MSGMFDSGGNIPQRPRSPAIEQPWAHHTLVAREHRLRPIPSIAIKLSLAKQASCGSLFSGKVLRSQLRSNGFAGTGT
jgi:hypothetical protein